MQGEVASGKILMRVYSTADLPFLLTGELIGYVRFLFIMVAFFGMGAFLVMEKWKCRCWLMNTSVLMGSWTSHHLHPFRLCLCSLYELSYRFSLSLTFSPSTSFCCSPWLKGARHASCLIRIEGVVLLTYSNRFSFSTVKQSKKKHRNRTSDACVSYVRQKVP